MPALLSWVNWLDRASAVITASSQAGALGATRLAEPQLRARWRTAVGVVAPQLDVDFGASREVGIVALAQPDDAGGVNADGEPRGWMAPADRVWHRLDDGAAGLTNLVTSPELFSAAAWTKASSTIAGGLIASPDAGGFADQITWTATTGRVSQTITVPADTTTYRMDVWLRDDNAGSVNIRMRAGSTVRVSGLLVNLATGAVSTASFSNYTPENVTVTDYGNGWWRVGFSMPNVSQPDIRFDIAANTAVSTRVFAWGAQLVPGTMAMGYRGSTATPGINGPGVGSALDTASIAGGWRSGYGMHVYQPASPINARYWRCNLNAASLASVPGFVDLGRAWAGPVWTPARGNLAYGFAESWTDGSLVERNPRSGLEFVDLGPRARMLNFAFSALTESDAAQIRELQRVAGLNRQILFVPFPGDGPDLAAPIIGRLTEVPPITLPRYARYAVTFQLRQSL